MRPDSASNNTAQHAQHKTPDFLSYCAHFPGLCCDEQPRKTVLDAITDEKTFDSPRSHLLQRESASFNSRLHQKNDHQADSLFGASVHRRTFLRREHAHSGPFEAPTARGTGHCRRMGAAVDLRATLDGSFC